jgi:hypothetical protein
MHSDHQVFLDALRDKKRLTVSFFDRKEKRDRVRICAPLDYGPLRGANDTTERYQLWDLEGKRKPLNFALLEGDIASMKPLDETFDPATIITWAFKPNAWAVPRDWAEFS